uniref:Tetrapyrrole biosynthesis glutamyl-tRNA reductase dimerisation domain-containing protein n=1 Tax=Quercus lobata TaxID=97700 RepID=A0A7N2N606_QUELO
MAVLPMPYSIKLHPNMPVSKASLVITGRRSLAHVNKQIKLVANPTLTKDTSESDCQSWFSDPNGGNESHEGLDKKVGHVIQRLETVVECVIELEIQKFNRKIKGDVTCEQSILVEIMSRDIVSKFLEKPIKYLRSNGGNLDEKLKEMNFLAGVLEESCLTKEEVNA